MAWLPKDVCVVADNHLVPHLTSRDYTTVAQADTPDPDFIALDMFAPDTGGNPPAPVPYDVYAEALNNHYRIVFTDGTFVILQSPQLPWPVVAVRAAGQRQTRVRNPIALHVGSVLPGFREQSSPRGLVRASGPARSAASAT